MNILIIGGEGQLGSSIKQLIPHCNFATFHITTMEELDISSEENIKNFFNQKKFDFIVNCTAYTAVDNAENDVEKARLINALAPQWIARQARKQNAGIIHVSTDYVFDGTSNLPLTPDMHVNPISVYGKTKLEGEQLVIKENPEYIIIRTAWLYSEYGSNFVKTMQRLGNAQQELKVVFDQTGTPTYAGDLASVILSILEKANNDRGQFATGIYHYTNEGVCSWYDFAIAIFKMCEINISVHPARTDEFPTTAKRPTYSVMDNSKIRNQFNITIPYWSDSLKKCLKNMQNT